MPSRGHRRMMSVFILLLALLAISVFGCAEITQPIDVGNMSVHQVFRTLLPVGPSGAIATLDPDLASDSASRTVVSLLYDGLVTLDQHLHVELWGARQVAISSDGLTYIFHLRPNQRFADGTPVTAADYAYSINRALNPCLASPLVPSLFAIKNAATFANEACIDGRIGVNTDAGQTGPVITTLLGDALLAPDDSTLVVTLAQPAGYFLEALTTPASDALNPEVVGPELTSGHWIDTLDQPPSGSSAHSQGTSGIYTLVAWDHAHGTLMLSVNPYWWGLSQGRHPYLYQIDVTLVKSEEDAYTAYQTGLFHMSTTPTDKVAEAKMQPDFHTVDTLTYNGLTFNWTKPPFNDLNARQGFCLVVNRDMLGSVALDNLVIPSWSIVPAGMPGFDLAITGPDGVANTAGADAAAVRHWTAYQVAAGIAKLPPIPYLYDNSNPSAKAVAHVLQAQWQQALGVQISLRGESHAAWQQDVDAGNYVIAPFSATLDYPDPHDVLSRLFLNTTGTQLPDVPAADTLMARADASGDEAARLQLYQQAEQLLINSVVTCPLFQGQKFYQVRQCVHGWSLAPNGLAPLDTWINTYLDNTCPNA